jgi:spoIIIJ-associated protein
MINKQEIENLIKDLIHKVNVKVNKVDVSEDKGAKTWFSVEVSEPHFFINRDGEALHALNHLVRRILENKSPAEKDATGLNFNENILIDINDFQKKRVESIRAVAHMMSERARYFKSSVEVDPMSSFDRRIVHEFLSDATDLKTESIGVGPGRRVVIKYIGTSA